MSSNLSDFTGKARQEAVTINGVTLVVKEFDMKTRAMWLDISGEYELAEKQSIIQSEVIPRISGLGHGVERDPRVKSIQARVSKLQDKHDAVMDVYATEDEPEDVEQQLSTVLDRMEKVSHELDEMMEVVQNELVGGAKEAEKAIADLMETQDKARIYFVWLVASTLEKTGEPFDDFYDGCGGSDFKAADRLLREGNAPWASLYTDRMQEKPKKATN